MSDDLDERIHPPSPRRRREARERGLVATSPDLTSTFVLFAVALAAAWFGTDAVLSLARSMRQMLSAAPVVSAADYLWTDALGEVAMTILTAVCGISLTAVAAALAGEMTQSGWLVSWQRIAPEFGRVSPDQGFARLLAAMNPCRLLGELLRWGVAGGVIGVTVWASRDRWQAAIIDEPRVMLEQVHSLLTRCSLQLAAALLLIGLVRYAWAWRRLERSLSLTTAELREEHRHAHRSRRHAPTAFAETPPIEQAGITRDAG